MDLFIVAVCVNSIVKRKFLVRANFAEQAVGIVEQLNRSEARQGEPLYPAGAELQGQTVEFVEGVCDL